MLDEPPLIVRMRVRMRGLPDCVDNSFVISAIQTTPVLRRWTCNPYENLRSPNLPHLNEHRSVFRCRPRAAPAPGDVQRKAERCPHPACGCERNKKNKSVDKPVELDFECDAHSPRAIRADHATFRPYRIFEFVRPDRSSCGTVRLGEHEVPKLIPGKGSLLVEDHPPQIFLNVSFPSS